MDWLDALFESAMAFAKDVKPRSISDLAPVVRTAEQALADTSKPIPAAITPMTWPTSERDEIPERVSNFRAHQETMAREREDYYLQVKAKMLAGIDPDSASGPKISVLLDLAAKFETRYGRRVTIKRPSLG
jgi:hypothetical protein